MTMDPDGAANEPGAQPTRTGVERIDEVIQTVEQLRERPIGEHVEVFEAAHTRLRESLDETGQ